MSGAKLGILFIANTGAQPDTLYTIATTASKSTQYWYASDYDFTESSSYSINGLMYYKYCKSQTSSSAGYSSTLTSQISTDDLTLDMISTIFSNTVSSSKGVHAAGTLTAWGLSGKATPVQIATCNFSITDGVASYSGFAAISGNTFYGFGSTTSNGNGYRIGISCKFTTYPTWI